MNDTSNPNKRYSVEAVTSSDFFLRLEDVQIVFHGVNKSSSLCMANVLRDAYLHDDREDEWVSHYHTGGPIEKHVQRVENRSTCNFSVGHYLYGALKPSPHRIWITLFRHPLPRVLSCYQWLKNKHEKANPSGEGYSNLETFITNTKGTGHSQISQFGNGYGSRRKSKKLSAKDMFEISIETIERDIYCLGLAEHFEDSVFLFARLAGLTSVTPWRRDNRNKGRPLVDTIEPHIRDLIYEVYDYDFQLYDWVVKRFRTQNAKIDFGPDLADYKVVCQAEYKDRILIN